MNTHCTLCDGCDRLFGADPFSIVVNRRGHLDVTECCSAVCGIEAIKAIPIGADFISLTIEVLGAYDLKVLQKVLKGTK
jgi:hypothetical protein